MMRDIILVCLSIFGEAPRPIYMASILYEVIKDPIDVYLIQMLYALLNPTSKNNYQIRESSYLWSHLYSVSKMAADEFHQYHVILASKLYLPMPQQG